MGPNGSGKSNISDSIRWVLGETSSKQLRGAGKMEDVIFGGTQTRGAMGYAAVSLTIDNSDHGLEMDADEVTIGRRYYRSGGERVYHQRPERALKKMCTSCCWIPALGAMATPLWVRGALRRSLVQNPPSGARFLRKHLALPNTATAK